MKEAIAILTGGGPAPGMNTVVGSVAKTFLRKGYRVIGLHEGYTGLFNPSPRTVDIDYPMADGIFNQGGSFLQMSRTPSPTSTSRRPSTTTCPCRKARRRSVTSRPRTRAPLSHVPST